MGRSTSSLPATLPLTAFEALVVEALQAEGGDQGGEVRRHDDPAILGPD
jgi:hypothetical protein